MTDQELDRLLDSAIASYVVEPEPGLAARIRVGRRRWPWVAAALAVAAGLAMWVPLPEAPAPPVWVSHAAGVPDVPLVRVEMPAPRPKAVSPRSIPMTAQEQMLVRFVQAHPDLAQQVFVEAPREVTKPLEIEPLSIAPLEVAGDGQ